MKKQHFMIQETASGWKMTPYDDSAGSFYKTAAEALAGVKRLAADLSDAEGCSVATQIDWFANTTIGCVVVKAVASA